MKSIIVGLAGLAIATAAQAEETLTPTDKWTLNVGQDRCTMGRMFKHGERVISVGFEATPPGPKFTLLIAAPAAALSEGTIAVSAPGVETVTSSFTATGSTQSGDTLWSDSFDRRSLGPLLAAPYIVVEVGEVRWKIPTAGSAAVVSAIGGCQANLLRGWKVDPAELAKNPDLREPGLWMMNDDYPLDAVRLMQQGSATIIWLIEANGSVRDCRVVVSSGSQSLDAASCSMVRQRANYQPPLQPSDRPISRWGRMTVKWTMPGMPVMPAKRKSAWAYGHWKRR